MTLNQRGFRFALFAFFLAGCGGEDARIERPTRTVRVLATTAAAEGIEGVAVRLGTQVVITDSTGEARFEGLDGSAALQVEATCPQGYSGERLDRVVPVALVQSADQWSFAIHCEPEFLDVSLAVVVSECDGAILRVDGVEVGATEDGMFHFVQRRSSAGTLEVEARETTADCKFRSTKQTFSFDRTSPGIWAHFDGVRVKKRRSSPRRTEAATARPYRL